MVFTPSLCMRVASRKQTEPSERGSTPLPNAEDPPGWYLYFSRSVNLPAFACSPSYATPMIWNRELSTLLTKSAPLTTSGLTARTEEANSATSAVKVLRNYPLVSMRQHLGMFTPTCAILKIYGETGSTLKGEGLVWWEDLERVAARSGGTAVSTTSRERNQQSELEDDCAATKRSLGGSTQKDTEYLSSISR